MSAAAIENHQHLDAARAYIRSAPFYDETPLVRAQAEHLLQALVSVAYGCSIAPRPEIPHILTETFNSPATISHSGPNSDAVYGLIFHFDATQD